MKRLFLLIITILSFNLGCSIILSIDDYTCSSLAEELKGEGGMVFFNKYEILKITDFSEVSRSEKKLVCYSERVLTDVGEMSATYMIEDIDGEFFWEFQPD